MGLLQGKLGGYYATSSYYGIVKKSFDVFCRGSCAEDPLEASLSLAREITERSPDAVAATKKLFQDTYAGATEQAGLELETRLQKKLLVSWNQVSR